MHLKKTRIKMEAQRYLEKKLWQKAILEFKKLLYLDEDDISTRLKIAELYVKIGDSKSAVENYLSAANFYASKGLITKVNDILKHVLQMASETKKIPVALEQEDISAFIHTANSHSPISLFSNLIKGEIDKVTEKLTEKMIPKDKIVISEGDKNDSLYIVKNGILKVTTKSKDHKERFLAKLTKDDFFGELSLLTGAPRSATITTMTDCTILELTKKAFDDLSAKFPEIKKVLLDYCEARERITELTKTKKFGKRKHIRHNCNMPLRYRLLSEDTKQEGRNMDGIMKDISLGGICIEVDGRDMDCDNLMILGKKVVLDIPIFEKNNTFIKPTGRIVWSQQAVDESVMGYRFFIGVIFSKMKEDELHELDKMTTGLRK